ncbi:Uncharacterised protein [uncultured archaeon]|nr:Uncharacterised protein [uncultured archaeon]
MEQIEIIGHEGKPVKRNPVFLKEWDITPWNRPCAPGYIRSGLEVNASTKLSQALGKLDYKTSEGNYTLNANGTVYRAMIARCDPKERYLFKESKPTMPEEDCILFDGGIVISQNGIIPGTNLEGFFIERVGEIWTARKYEEGKSTEEMFGEILFGENSTVSRIERVEQIITGYETQKSAEHSAQMKRNLDSYDQGRFHESERPGRLGW